MTMVVTDPPASTPLAPLPGAGYGNPAQNDAYGYVADLLARYDLGSLSDWAWQQIVDGRNGEQVIQSLRQREEYATRFKGMAIRQANGLPAVSEGEYIAYERQAQQLMRRRGDAARILGQPRRLRQPDRQGRQRERAQPAHHLRLRACRAGAGRGALGVHQLLRTRRRRRVRHLLPRPRRRATVPREGGYPGRDRRHRRPVRDGDPTVDGGTPRRHRCQPGIRAAGLHPVEPTGPPVRGVVTEAQDLRMGVEGVGATFGTDAAAAAAVAKRKETREAAMAGVNPQATTAATGIVGLGAGRGYCGTAHARRVSSPHRCELGDWPPSTGRELRDRPSDIPPELRAAGA